MTKILDFASGPGVGKSLISALVFAEMKLRHLNVEYIQEYPKKLVLLKRFDELDNQRMVSFKQYRILKALENTVDYIVFDSSLASGLFYNRDNVNNTSCMEKCERAILDWYNSFDTYTIHLVRGDYPYENKGRYQDYDGSCRVQEGIRRTLIHHNIPFVDYFSDPSPENIKKIVDGFLEHTTRGIGSRQAKTGGYWFDTV